MKKLEKSEIERLIDLIFYKQTYGKDCEKELDKLNELTGYKRRTTKIPLPRNIKNVILSDTEIKDLARIRNYFGENDKTPFQHMAYDLLDKILSQYKTK